jgi:tetratricopeptide (TPR) repeat protein
MIMMVILVGGGAAVFWGKNRLVPDLAAEAQAAYARQDWKGTELLVRQRLKQVPDDPKALQLGARAAAHLDRDQSAIAIYSRLVVADMDPVDFRLLGRALSRTGQSDPAMIAYETALSGDPDHAETLDALAQLYLQNDRYDAAERLAERLARRPGWEARGLLVLGTVRAELEDPAGAAEALRRWLQLDPEGRSAAPNAVRPFRALLIRSLLKSRQPAEARGVAQGLLASGPAPELSWLLSRSFIQERDWSRASAAWKAGSSYRGEHPLEFEPAPYIGAARCAECHRAEYQTQVASRHAASFALARDLDQLPLPDQPIPDPANPRVTHQFTRDHDSLRVETRAIDQVFRAVVDYAFGAADRFRTFTGLDDQGHSVMIRMSHYESPRGSGWDLATGLPPQPAEAKEYLGKPMLDRDGIRRCLFCHTTNFRAVRDQTGPEAVDHAIGCEKCHGPGGHHVAAVEARFADPAIASRGEATAAAINEQCGRCHSMHHTEKISAPRTDPVWSRFQSLSLTWSRCYTESQGQLSCVTCHDPHKNVETSTALNEAKCLSCHTAEPAGLKVTVTRAAPGDGPRTASASTRNSPNPVVTSCPVNSTTGCLDCHMPRAWTPSTHSFKTDHFIRVRERARN